MPDMQAFSNAVIMMKEKELVQAENMIVDVTGLAGVGMDPIAEISQIIEGTAVETEDPTTKPAKRKRRTKEEMAAEKQEADAEANSKIIGQKDIKRMLKVAADQNLAALLVGETGTGKTSIIQDMARLRGRDCTRLNLTGDTTVDEFVGKYVLIGGETVWQDGILLQAMKKGHWLIVDEINVALPEILFALHPLLDDDKAVLVSNHEGEIVKPHADFRFFATMNPTDEYAGTKELNKAFKSRFNVILYMDYLGKKDEIEAIHRHTGLDKFQVAKMVDVASKVRQAKAKNVVYYTFSTRDLIHWATLAMPETGLSIDDAFTVAVLGKAPEDKVTVIKFYAEVMGRYQALSQQVGAEELTIEWFEKKHFELQNMESQIEKKVREELRQRLNGLV